MITDQDHEQLCRHGLSPAQVDQQLSHFQNGVEPMKLVRACTVDDGIIRLLEDDQRRLDVEFEAVAATGRVSKFVPASGAASRMFQQLIDVYTNGDDADEDSKETVLEFQARLAEFAFASAVEACGGSLEADTHALLEQLLTEQGLNYAETPKGLIPFHRYADSARTPFGEHLAEGTAYGADDEGTVRIHFTVSAEHVEQIEAHLEQCRTLFPDHRFRIGLSVQQANTDTVAADAQGEPFRTDEGRLLFRPGGHGALLANLDQFDGDIVVVKNIDNALPTYRAEEAFRWKRILTAYLAETQEQVYDALHTLEGGADADEIEAIKALCRETLHLDISTITGDHTRQTEALATLLNRPIRICGVVRNQGEPGGGPFWVSRHGTVTRQIVERAEIDLDDASQAAIADSATHFNPVDLVCGVRNYRGRLFNLTEFRDDSAVFLAQKSHQGRDLQALEWPGLWNGSMANWITLFIETPLETFNPVKTVMDLLRDAHQPLS